MHPLQLLFYKTYNTNVILLLRFLLGQENYFFARLTNLLKASGSKIASWLSIFLFNSTFAFLRPCMNLLYDNPCSVEAAPIRVINKLLISRFFSFLPLYAKAIARTSVS